MSGSWEYGEAAEVAATSRFPWPPAEGEGIVRSFGETWKSATFDPGRFFARVPREGGTGAAVVYYLVVGVLVAGAGLFWNSLSLFGGGLGREELAADLGIMAISPVVTFLLTPAFLLGILAVSAAITHMILSLFDGGRHGFGTTVRVFCYAYSPGLFGVVPVIGGILGSIWMVVLLILGLKEAHRTDGWKAAVAVLLPAVLLFGLLVVAVLVVIAAGAAVMGAG